MASYYSWMARTRLSNLSPFGRVKNILESTILFCFLPFRLSNLISKVCTLLELSTKDDTRWHILLTTEKVWVHRVWNRSDGSRRRGDAPAGCYCCLLLSVIIKSLLITSCSADTWHSCLPQVCTFVSCLKASPGNSQYWIGQDVVYQGAGVYLGYNQREWNFILSSHKNIQWVHDVEVAFVSPLANFVVKTSQRIHGSWVCTKTCPINLILVNIDRKLFSRIELKSKWKVSTQQRVHGA
jgi:hypothetical protein